MNNSQARTNNILDSLNPVYFWDVNKAGLDQVKSKRLIIERVFSLGTMEEMQNVVAFYGREETVDVLKKVTYLDPKTLNFASIIFNIPKTDFKCYKRRQSNRQLWNF